MLATPVDPPHQWHFWNDRIRLLSSSKVYGILAAGGEGTGEVHKNTLQIEFIWLLWWQLGGEQVCNIFKITVTNTVMRNKKCFMANGCQVIAVYTVCCNCHGRRFVVCVRSLENECAAQTLISRASFLEHTAQREAFWICRISRGSRSEITRQNGVIFFSHGTTTKPAAYVMNNWGSRSLITKFITSSIMRGGRIINTHTNTHSSDV